MTDLVIRSLARRPARYLVRPSVALVLAVVLAYTLSTGQVLVHAREGGAEEHEPGILLHVLRDGTMSLPAVLTAVWLGLLGARRLVDGARAHGRRLLAGAVMASCVAVAVAGVLALLAPLHAGLFGAHEGGHELGFLAHAGRDAMRSLALALPLAAGVSAGLLWRDASALAPPAVERWRAPEGRAARGARRAAIALVALAPVAVMGQQQVQLALAEPVVGAPCAPAAPVKSYAVSAIRVDIPLNRFGDHDPGGWMYVLDSEIPAVRAQEASRHVQLGLRDDPIQPLVIRANLGDCVEITFTNRAGGEIGAHVDGLSYDVASSGDAIGENTPSSAANGETRTYRYYVPEDDRLEGNHYLRPGPGMRSAVSHGLFGSLTIEPKGSTYLHPDTREPIRSGWEAIIVPGSGKSFREYVNLYHEVGDEEERGQVPVNSAGSGLPTVDPTTASYRPGSRAINYRTEPFMNRLARDSNHKAQAYNSYTFGDPATPIQRSYLGDPTKIRVLSAGSELFHVFHLHGGGIRWRLDPVSDPTFSYSDTGLDKQPAASRSPSSRLDSQSLGPGEAYNLEIEGGAGGVQQSAGDFLSHCHIVEHYVSGMWAFWRVHDTMQPDLAVLPDRVAPPTPVDSTALIGRTMPDGTTLTAANLPEWIAPQLPPKGRPLDSQDGAVWDWQFASSAGGPLALGEPADTTNWANNTRPADRYKLEGHPGLRAGDVVVGADNRPKILFNPLTGRPAFPLLRNNIGQRPPFSGNGHTGAPFLGERGNQPRGAGPSPYAGRPDGICPAGAPTKTFNVVSVQRPIQVTRGGATDANGKVFTLAADADAVQDGSKPAEPLVIRANTGDCGAVTLASRQQDDLENPFSMTNLHNHHVQFDVQGSDGAGTGLQYGQSVRPYQLEDPTLSVAAGPGDRILRFAAVPAKFRPGVFIGVGIGTETIEVAEIASVNGAAGTVELVAPLTRAHAAGHTAGVEFVQYRWFADVQLDNVFFHDHVDGIHNWGHGLVGQLIVEPPGSTYHDPTTGEPLRSGAIADIRTNGSLAPGLLDGSFREVALTTIDGNPATDSTINLRAAPWSERLGADPDPSLLFSSYRHGDPITPLLRAYRGDPVVVRTINASPTIDSLRIAGSRMVREPGRTSGSSSLGSYTDTLRYGVSERWTAVLEDGDNGATAREGDHLYFNGVGRRFRQGAWGLLRVLGGSSPKLQPLPGRGQPSATHTEPVPTNGRPPVAGGPGEPCPSGIPERDVAISAVDVPGATPGRTAAFVPTADADAVRSGSKAPVPLVLHVPAGTCLNVTLTNSRAATLTGPAPRASFHVGEAITAASSRGMNVGFGPEQTVAAGTSRTYRIHVDTRRIGSAPIADFGGLDSGAEGLYGLLVVAPSGATVHDPVTGERTMFGTSVDVRTADGGGYRDFTAILADDDEIIGGDTMPYPSAVAPGAALLNYAAAPRAESASAFSSRANGDPATGVLRAYAGDPMRMHVMVAPGSEQPHVASLGGHVFPGDPEIARSSLRSSQGVAAWESYDLHVEGGAGGWARARGDAFYGDLRRPFTAAGMWGLLRIMSDASCPIRPLPGADCLGKDPVIPTVPTRAPDPQPAPPSQAATPAAPVPAAPVPVAPPVGPPPIARAPATIPSPLGLKAPRTLSLATFRRKGVRFTVLVPKTTRTVEVRLLRAKGSKKSTGIRGVLATRRGGRVTLRFRPSGRALKRLRRGTYVLAVRMGPSRAKLTRDVLKSPLTLR